MYFCTAACGFRSSTLTECSECGAKMIEHKRCPGCVSLRKVGAFHRCVEHDKEIFNPDMAGCSDRRTDETGS